MSLNNYFKQKQIQDEKEQEQARLQKQQKYEQHRSVRSVQLKARADNRIDNFQETKMSQQFVNTMKNGTIPLLPIANHSFRDRFKDKEMDETGGIYIKTFHVAKDRAQLAQDNFHTAHLKEDLFDPNLPNKNYQNWLRVDNVSKQDNPMRFGLGERTENGRVYQIIDNQSKQIDHQQRDMKMVNFPDWKEPQKNKWMSKNTFDVYPCMAKVRDPIWDQIPINHNNQNNQFIDGYEVTGDLSRKRFKEKEVFIDKKFKKHKRVDFQSTVKPDQIGTTLHISKSLRTMKGDKVLQISKEYDEYSKNKQLTFYKSTLIQTKSIDHITPHEHSNNYQGLPLKDLRPNAQDKQYKLSVNLHQRNLITKEPPNSADMKTTTKTVANLDQNLANIQEVSQNFIQSGQLPQSRGSLTSGAKSRYMDCLSKRTNDGQIKLGYPYHQENDEKTKEVIGKYFS